MDFERNDITQKDLVKSQVLTLEKTYEQGYQFSIPSYQRPYVWSDEAVLKLFDDICKAQNECESSYFIGTVLTSTHQLGNGEKIYELIDGQQRTTTLMLIAIAFKMAGVDAKITHVPKLNQKPRLQFDIREQVQQLLGNFAGLKEFTSPSSEEINKDEYLNRIYAALAVLKQRISSLADDKQKSVADYIFSSVQWVNNTVPVSMDLNRLFATMNTSGIQLEQTDILKSKLLERIKSDKSVYESMWSACEHMDNYFEKNLRNLFPNADWNSIEFESLVTFKSELFAVDKSTKESTEGLTIAELIREEPKPEHAKSKSSNAVEITAETVYCRPIINFSLLLIHTYRIHLAQLQQEDICHRIHQDKLLQSFEALTSSNEEEVKNFIKLLWKIRFQFDRWVVKWVERDDSDDEQLRLTYQSRSQSGSNWYINRNQREVEEITLLQSVRNFTGERSAQYWLTPFLAELVENQYTTHDQVVRLIERIDNSLSLAGEDETQKTASFKLAQHQKPITVAWKQKSEYLTQSRGTSFEHYWFQKLEYLLWKQIKTTSNGDKNFSKFRITSKNSVEHVHPQHEEYESVMDRDFLDAFGNLVLLSPSENSSYSNQAVKKKKIDFENKDYYDSLKLKMMFDLLGEQEDWDEEKIKAHQKDMLGVLAKHYIN
ncbi:DUF262 domain-containing protein [Shewanella sp. 202IG2-18]|uniref:DUF262 domain-containing protein n=1 Tax=Parashewanella hymeniacidonis TaxID=2807618 RepID=UPI00195FA352|nr:DUF262 domain-containing protein [Parashewanella hymeniacidonis]MBM7070663.1 DUF262 domain-containing protein [Parashewanella hymeniacidonis]